MSRYKPYPKYKESGVEWIGAVPEGWKVATVKAYYDIRLGKMLQPKALSTADVAALYHRAQTIQWEQIDNDAMTEMWASPNEIERFSVSEGDLLICEGGDVCRSALVSELPPQGPVIFQNSLHRVRSRGSREVEWVMRLMQHLRSSSWIDVLCNKSTFLHFTSEKLGALACPVPPPDEQAAIIVSTRSECSRIDALVAKKTHFIVLLREKRQALITHAVTKGLHPEAPMKNSGVEWIGKVPAHWEIARVANAYREADRGADPTLPVLSVSIHYGITDEELAPEERDRRVSLSEDRMTYKRVVPNDLVYNMMRAWQGAFGAVEVEGLVSPAYVVAEPTMPLRSRFVELLLRTGAAVEEMRRYSRGVADFRMRLYWDYFRDIKIPLPPLDEQDKILRTIHSSAARIDALIMKIERSIELLRERRSAFITEAVTGQIDLREEARTDATQAA